MALLKLLNYTANRCGRGYFVITLKAATIMVRIFLLICTLSLASCGERGPSAVVVDSGLYDAVIVKKGNWKIGMPVEISSTHNVEHREDVDRIPAEDGIYWGLRVRLTNPTSEPVPIRIVLEHPEFTNPVGETSSKEIEEGHMPPKFSDTIEFLWFFLEGSEYEFVPGKWIRRIYLDGREVVHKEFEVFTND